MDYIIQHLYLIQSHLLKEMPEKGSNLREALNIVDSLLEELDGE